MKGDVLLPVPLEELVDALVDRLSMRLRAVAAREPYTTNKRGPHIPGKSRRWLLDHIHSSPQLVEALTFELGRQAVQIGDEALSVLRATAIVLALAMAVYSRREYDSRPRD